MNYYKTSTGERIPKSVVDARIRKAKELKLEMFLEEHGYFFCEDCGIASGVRLDCSHDYSVDKCQKEGKVELAWDVGNIKLRCRDCHRKKDGLDLKFNK